MKVYRMRGGITPLLLNLGTRWEWLTSRLGRLRPWKERQYLLSRRLRGPQSQSGRFGEEKNLSHLLDRPARTRGRANLSVYWREL